MNEFSKFKLDKNKDISDVFFQDVEPRIEQIEQNQEGLWKAVMQLRDEHNILQAALGKALIDIERMKKGEHA